MASFLFPKGLERFLKGQIAFHSDTIKVIYNNNAIYQPLETDEYLSDLVDDAVQSGSTWSTSAGASAGNLRITGLTDMSADYVGHYLTLAGAGTSANNGVFYVVAYNSPTSVDVKNQNGDNTDTSSGDWSIAPSSLKGADGLASPASGGVLPTKTTTNGTAGAANVSIANVTAGPELGAIILFKDMSSTTDNLAAYPLISYNDSAPFTPDGRNETITFTDNLLFDL